MKPGRMLLGLVAVGGTILSACGKAGDDDTLTVAASGEDSGRPEDRFGKGFGEKFRADPYSEPTPVREGDVPPLSLTAEPLPVD